MLTAPARFEPGEHACDQGHGDCDTRRELEWRHGLEHGDAQRQEHTHAGPDDDAADDQRYEEGSWREMRKGRRVRRPYGRLTTQPSTVDR